ncbi:MAG: hypothetical protein R3C11_15105 [Planctomycetaceae bacterium]
MCLLVVCLTGCTTFTGPTRYSLFVKPEAEEASEPAAEEKNPFKKDPSGPVVSRKKEGGTTNSASEGSLAKLDFDDETNKLIADRLAELPPDPKLRAERLAAWKELSPEQVKQVIRVERLAASAVEQQQNPMINQGMIRTVSAEKSPSPEVLFVPNAEAGHSGFPGNSPFTQMPAQNSAPAQFAAQAAPPTNNGFTLPGDQPVTFVPAAQPQPQSPLGVALNEAQQQVAMQQSPAGSNFNSAESPFQQQTVNPAPFPGSDTVVMVPQQSTNVSTAQVPQYSTAQNQSLPAGQPGVANPAAGLPNNPAVQTDADGNGFVRGLTNAPQSLKQFCRHDNATFQWSECRPADAAAIRGRSAIC